MNKTADAVVLEKQIISVMDLTSLNSTDSDEVIVALCHQANTAYGHVAAVCVYPEFVSLAVSELSGSAVKIATVANFPDGMQTLDLVSASIAESLDQGANEIDVVFPYPQFLAGNEETVLRFIESCKGLCGSNILLKVILESGAFPLDKIAAASELALSAGADFLKTSTGKFPVGATLEAAEIMLGAIKKSKRPAGLKVSGGVRTIEQAESYIQLANRIMGDHWVQPSTFRIGASQLLDNVIHKLSE